MPIQLNESPKKGLPDLDDFFKKLTPNFKKKTNIFEPKKTNWKWWSLICVIVVLVILIFSSMVTVGAGQSLVITRFGAYYATEGQGRHWTIPFIDKRIIIELTQSQEVSYDAETLTQEGDLVKISAQLTYQIEDPKAYLFGGDAEAGLQAALSQATTTVSLVSPFAALIDNANWSQVGKNIAENVGDVSSFGVKVTGVEVQNIQVPAALAGDFNKSITTAEAQSKQLLSDANTFAVNLQPLAAQKAANSIAYANAEKFATMVSATRDAAEFASLVPAYQADSATSLAYLPLLLANNWQNIQAITSAQLQMSTQRENGQASYLRWKMAAQQSQNENQAAQ